MIKRLLSIIVCLLLICTVQAETGAATETIQAVSEEPIFPQMLGYAFWPCLWGSMLFIMLKQIKKEKEREWTPLTVDDEAAAGQSIRSNFEALASWSNDLKDNEVNGEVRKFITTHSQLEKGFALLAELSSLPDLNDAEKKSINILGIDLNEAQKRHHTSSLKARILVALLYFCILGGFPIILCLLTGGASFSWVIFLLCNSAIVLMLLTMNYADMRPAYKFQNEGSGFTAACRSILAKMHLGFLNEADREFHTKYYDVYEDSNGKKWYHEPEPFEGTFNAIIILGIGYFIVLPLVIVPYSLFCFLSHYIIKK